METKKNPPVDRGKLLIALECCRMEECKTCPYDTDPNEFDTCQLVVRDALAYIGYLEERLEEAVGHDA